MPGRDLLYDLAVGFKLTGAAPGNIIGGAKSGAVPTRSGRLAPGGGFPLSSSQFTLTDAMRAQAIGAASAPVAMEVEKGHIARFAEAIGDDNPAYTLGSAETGGIVAPPTFLRAMRGVRPELPFEAPLARVLDGGSDWEYFDYVRPGDTITAVARIEDIRERTGSIGQMLIATVKITYRNQHDAVVATQTSTSIRY